MKNKLFESEQFQTNFKLMSPEMKRHLAMNMSYFTDPSAGDKKAVDPLFGLDSVKLQEFYTLNPYLYPEEVRARLRTTRKESARRALYLLGQSMEPHIFQTVNTEDLREEMQQQVIGQEEAKQLLQEMVEKTNETHRPFRVLLVGHPGVGKTLLAELVAKHYRSRSIECGSICTSAYFVGSESNYSDSDYGMLVDMAMAQTECLLLSGIDRMEDGEKNGNPFASLTQLLRDHMVQDLYLGVPVHINTNVIAEAASSKDLPPDLLNAFDAVLTMAPPTQEERIRFGNEYFEKLTAGRVALQRDVMPFLLDNYCPDDGMRRLAGVTERLAQAAAASEKPYRMLSARTAGKLLGPAALDDFERNVLKFRRNQDHCPETMKKIGIELMEYIANNRDRKEQQVRNECEKARMRFSCLAGICQEAQPFRFDQQAFDHGMESMIGVESVKNVLRAHLAGMEASNTAGRPVLLAGPAGTGKTQLGRTLAKALDLPFEKLSCAGCSANSIKGSSIVYENSKPGLIASAFKRAGTSRMLLLLDEVDKAQQEAQWALLDLLDGHHLFFEQHLGCDMDVSQTVFVLTANDLSQLSPILRDRCDLVMMNGYNADEKMEICRQSMLPLALHKYGLAEDTFPEELLRQLVEGYCVAPGCRDLESCLNRLCEEEVLHHGAQEKAPAEYLKELFGKPVTALDEYPQQLPEDACGIVRILAVAANAAGASFGVSQAVQVLQTPRPGIVITGYAEDGLKESVLTALAAAEAATGKSLAKGCGLHVHFCGNSPKDGGSAGCAITLAVASLLEGVPVSRKIAMTGTIDLLGAVGKVGGIREKCQAALAAGCTQIYLPGGNRSDVEESLQMQAAAQGAEICFVDNFQELLSNLRCKNICTC